MSIQSVSDQGALEAAGAQAISLPVRRGLALAYASSLVIALLMALSSAAGLVCGTGLYVTEEMLLLKLPVDLFTLVVGLPILLGSMWLARRGKLLGLLCWPGALLYVAYIYLAYAIGVPFGVLFLVYVTLVILSTYTIIGLVASIDAGAVRRRLAGRVPARLCGGILVGITLLFTVMNLGRVVTALTSPRPDHMLEFPVWTADFLVLAPAWLVGGVLLWQRRALGYVAGAGLLLQSSMMFIGPIFALIFSALYNTSPVDVTGIVIMLVAGLICFVPFALFARGIVKSDPRPSPVQSAVPEGG